MGEGFVLWLSLQHTLSCRQNLPPTTHSHGRLKHSFSLSFPSQNLQPLLKPKRVIPKAFFSAPQIQSHHKTTCSQSGSLAERCQNLGGGHKERSFSALFHQIRRWVSVLWGPQGAWHHGICWEKTFLFVQQAPDN